MGLAIHTYPYCLTLISPRSFEAAEKRAALECATGIRDSSLRRGDPSENPHRKVQESIPMTGPVNPRACGEMMWIQYTTVSKLRRNNKVAEVNEQEKQKVLEKLAAKKTYPRH